MFLLERRCHLVGVEDRVGRSRFKTRKKPTEESLRRHRDLMPYVTVSSGSSYYDNVRPLAYPDSDAVLICFDISRPETLDSVIKKVSNIFFNPSPYTFSIQYLL